MRKRMLRALALGAALATGLVLGTGPALAVPPGGASPDTPGTEARIWPNELAPGDTINFEVSGFPAGETINVKIDDGEGYSDTTVAGSGVVHQQTIPSSGVVTGSFLLPEDIAAGEHWLRFLASEPVLDDAGERLGVNGFTLRGESDFVVVSADAATPDSGSGADGVDTGEADTSETDAGEANSAAQSDAAGSAFPWAGAAALGGAIVVVAGVLVLVLRRSGKRGPERPGPDAGSGS